MSSNNNPPKEKFYSALIEMVGIHDLAEEDNDSYTNRVGLFRTVIRTTLNAIGNLESRPWIDSCFFQTSDLSKLMVVLTHIRELLLVNTVPVFLRGAVKCGRSFQDDSYEKDAAILEGRVQRLKAAAIEVDGEVRDALVVMGRGYSQLLFRNQFLYGEGTRSQLVEFWDISVTRLFETRFSPAGLIREIDRNRSASTKSGRFYTPILMNFARNSGRGREWPDAPRIESEPADSKALEAKLRLFLTLIGDTEPCRMLQELPGGVLIYLVALDRYFLSQTADSLRNNLENTLKERLSEAKASKKEKRKTNPEQRDPEIADLQQQIEDLGPSDNFCQSFEKTLGKWIYKAKWIEKRLSLTCNEGLPPTAVIGAASRGRVRKAIEAAKDGMRTKSRPATKSSSKRVRTVKEVKARRSS